MVDPLDGTVNYFYGIPHFCVSIALRFRGEIIVGVIYDPMRDELWTARKGESADVERQGISRQRSAPISRKRSSRSAFRRPGATIDAGLPLLQEMVHRARKCRIMGSAALDLAYVACGRLDAYIEQGISLWDIAAGWLLVETAGGRVEMQPRSDMPDKFSIVASNGLLDLQLLALTKCLASGIGYDAHRFGDGRKLILGGVEIPHAHGLDGPFRCGRALPRHRRCVARRDRRARHRPSFSEHG